MYKNVASQKIAVFAWNGATGAPKTGDAANITGKISKDGGATASTNDTNPSELSSTDAPGVYLFDITQTESNADLIILQAKSSTASIQFRPVIIYTVKDMESKIDTIDTNVDSVLADTGELQTDLTDGGRLDLILDLISANAGLIPTML